jgi:endonuclease YncB( thermonuclease family)
MCFVSRFVFVCFAVFLAGVLFLPEVAFAASYDLSGRVHITKVSDGDSLRSGDLRIRLFGIDAPELKQQCADQNGVLWGCGVAAQRQLNGLIGTNKDLQCSLRDVDRYGRLIMQCFNGATDIGAAMVRSGHALAYRHFSDLYIAEEEQAKTALKGIWRGTFSPPWEWRR